MNFLVEFVFDVVGDLVIDGIGHGSRAAWRAVRGKPKIDYETRRKRRKRLREQ